MSSEIIKKENNQISLRIIVSEEKFEEAIEKAYHKTKSRFNVPGFRKGKTPRKIVELNYGREVFYEEAINFSFPEAYEAALEEHGLDPVGHPDVDIEQMETGKEVIFLADIEVMPEVVLGEYRGVEVEKTVFPVKEETVEAELLQLQEKGARLITVDSRPVQQGDQVTFDFEGTIDGEPFEGGTAEKHQLEIGSGRFIPGFEEKLVGLEAGQETELAVTFPEDYRAEELAGKDARFTVKIHEVREKEIPELDDELAKDVSEFDTLEELRNDLRRKLEESAEEREKQQLRSDVVKAVVDQVELSIPEASVTNQAEQMMQEFSHQITSQGLALDMYYQMTGTTENDLLERMKPDAERRVKEQLVLQKITETEEVAATDEEIDEEIENVAKQYGQEVDKFKEIVAGGDKKVFADSVILRKTIDFLVENATIKGEKVFQEKEAAENQE